MNRSLLHGGPARGHQDPRSTQDARSSQDARSNFAVQPAANAGSFKLKKNAVKIVSAAGPVPNAPLSPASLASTTSIQSRPATSLPISGPSPTTSLVASQVSAKENEPPRIPQLAVKLVPSLSTATAPPSKIELPPQSVDAKDSLEDIFARLSGGISSVLSRPAKQLSPIGADKSVCSIDSHPDTTAATAKAYNTARTATETQEQSALALSDHDRPHNNETPTQPLPEAERAPSAATSQGGSQYVHEVLYLRKAAAYLDALPTRSGDIAHDIKAVAKKLYTVFAPNVDNIKPVEAEKLQNRIVFAVTSAVNKKIRLRSESLTTDMAKNILREHNGNFLQLCAALVKDGCITLSDTKHIVDLCQVVLDVLPKADDGLSVGPSSKAPMTDVSQKPASSTARPGEALVKPAVEKRAEVMADMKINGDPLEGMKAWPTQEKREHGAIYRACVLRGVGGVKSLNQLQALVWGGRLESIQMPEPGSESALVKFLTPEACQTYLDATENGIEVQGAEKKIVIFVDKQPGPNSINDVIQNCIEGDVSRCVRATGADEDWSDSALFKLARGKQSIPRDVDCIKQGKTARGHHFIEFHFGNIYHALNFRRYLMDNDEWEHCSIGYAKDPCELARGLHYKDADEEGSSFFA